MKTFSNTYTIFIFILFFFTTLCISAQNDGIITVQSSEKIKEIITKKKAYNKNLKKINGFKIQLYNGSEEGAYKIRDNFSSMFPEISIKIQFFSPEWKVRVGNYKTRLEVDRALFEIREAFPSAIPITEMIDI